jgi:hypothetical protein
MKAKGNTWSSSMQSRTKAEVVVKGKKGDHHNSDYVIHRLNSVNMFVPHISQNDIMLV